MPKRLAWELSQSIMIYSLRQNALGGLIRSSYLNSSGDFVAFYIPSDVLETKSIAPANGLTKSPAVPDIAPFRNPLAPSRQKPSFGFVIRPLKPDQPEFNAEPTPCSIPCKTPTGLR